MVVVKHSSEFPVWLEMVVVIHSSVFPVWLEMVVVKHSSEFPVWLERVVVKHSLENTLSRSVCLSFTVLSISIPNVTISSVNNTLLLLVLLKRI